MAYEQSGLLVAVTSMPLVLESACRARLVTPDEMKSFRQSWSRVEALVSVNPSVMSLNSEIEMVKQGLPELVKLQPTWVYREVINSDSRIAKGFVRELGAIVAAPVENHKFRTDLLGRALTTPTPVHIEDESGGVGLCCACGKGRFREVSQMRLVHAPLVRGAALPWASTALSPLCPGVRQGRPGLSVGPTRWKWGFLSAKVGSLLR